MSVWKNKFPVLFRSCDYYNGLIQSSKVFCVFRNMLPPFCVYSFCVYSLFILFLKPRSYLSSKEIIKNKRATTLVKMNAQIFIVFAITLLVSIDVIFSFPVSMGNGQRLQQPIDIKKQGKLSPSQFDLGDGRQRLSTDQVSAPVKMKCRNVCHNGHCIKLCLGDLW